MGESGGDYNALFNYSNRAGGPFAGVNVTEMTIDDLLQFSDPDGPYGQYVKSQIGRVSTPMGGFQVVGSTLRMAKQGLGLKGNEKFDEAMQNRIGEYIFNQQGAGAWEALKKGGGIMNFMPQQPQQPMMPKEEKQGFDFRGIAAALDPLIMPEMRAGDAIRAQMDKEKAKKRTNQTVAYLRGLGTTQGEQLAARVESGQLKSSAAFRALMQLQQSDRNFEQEKELIDYRAQVQGAKDNRTAAIKEFEYGKENPEFLELLKIKNPSNMETPAGLEELDKAFAKSLSGTDAQTLAAAQQDAATIKSVVKSLRSGKNLTGPEFALLPEKFRAIVSPNSLQAQQLVESVVQKNLRAILGGQFAMKEGEQLVRRAYNPDLPEELNAARLEALLLALEAASENKRKMTEYFYKNNYSLRGYEGPQGIPTIEDFEAAIDMVEAPSQTSKSAATGGATIINAPDGQYIIKEKVD